MGAGTLVQQPHGEHTGVTPADPSPTDAERDSRRDETAPWIRMAINAESPVQQKTEKVWAGLTAGPHTYYFEYVPGLKEVTVGTCATTEGLDCNVANYPTTPTLQKTGCPTGFNLGWCWTGTVNVTDGNEIKVVARYTQTYPGYGATEGGKSATIIHVTNANASGAGSLQAAILDGCQNNEGRYIVFDVAPTIDLPNEGLRICGKEMTIDGWTSPGIVKLTTASVHFNCFDPDNSTPRGLNNRRNRDGSKQRDSFPTW
jgi:hypothetical protein